MKVEITTKHEISACMTVPSNLCLLSKLYVNKGVCVCGGGGGVRACMRACVRARA